MKCCEKWKNGASFRPTGGANSLLFEATYCPECGSKLESKWCECEFDNKGFPNYPLGMCKDCLKPKKPKQTIECGIVESDVKL